MRKTSVGRIIGAWALAGCLVAAMAAPAFAGDFRLVAGRRAGSIFLEMDRGSVHKLLGQPGRAVHLSSGLLQETWLGKTRPSNGEENGAGQRDYVAVLFRRGRVVQIEVTSPNFVTATGFSTGRTGAAWEKHYRPYRSTVYIYYYTATAKRAPKHWVRYEDDVRDGITWKYGVWGWMGPEPDPNSPIEAVVIHPRGRRVIPAAGGTKLPE